MNFSIPDSLFAEVDPKLIPFFLFAVGGAVAITAIVTRYQRQKAWYEVVRLSIEKGQPLSTLSEIDPNSLPPGSRFPSSCDRIRTPRRDLRSALILIAVSVGLHFGLNDIRSEHIHVVPGFFMIPGLIGVALLLNALIGFIFPPKRDGATTPPSKA